MRWTDPEQIAFFKSHIPEYKVTIKQHRRTAQAKHIANEFHKHWPPRLALWPNVPQDQTLTSEEDEALSTYIKKTGKVWKHSPGS